MFWQCAYYNLETALKIQVILKNRIQKSVIDKSGVEVGDLHSCQGDIKIKNFVV